MNNITLIGMPGAGKSSIGVVLAKVLGYQFIDSDLLIQKEEKRTLSEIIEQDGIDGFKAVENRVNASIQVENTVIATGGSVVYCDEAMQHLKSEGVVVYLKISLKLLKRPKMLQLKIWLWIMVKQQRQQNLIQPLQLRKRVILHPQMVF